MSRMHPHQQSELLVSLLHYLLVPCSLVGVASEQVSVCSNNVMLPAMMRTGLVCSVCVAVREPTVPCL